jgi:hypothetical protein
MPSDEKEPQSPDSTRQSSSLSEIRGPPGKISRKELGVRGDKATHGPPLLFPLLPSPLLLLPLGPLSASAPRL